MGLAAANATAAGRADGDWREKITRGAIAQPGQLGNDLVVTRVDVIGELNFGNRAQSVDTHSDGAADDTAFGNRRIDHPVFTMLPLQAVRGAKHAAEVTDILADDHHVRIPRRASRPSPS